MTRNASLKAATLIAVALSAVAPAAFAMTTELSQSQINEVNRYIPGADLSNLTTAQVQAIGAALNDGDGSGVRADLYTILNG